MNLELIKKYEKEFLHMLHGEKVLMGKKDPITNTTKWYPSVLNPFVETSDTTVVVIDDEYCTYRKALTEGKIIQYDSARSGGLINSWIDVDFSNPITFAKPIEYYRIKPKESEFKIGDWITVNGPTGTFTECISGIADDTYVLSGTNICYKSQATKWKPKEGEICLFWDGDYNGAIISKFSHMEQEKYSTNLYTWKNCMPFTGVLPQHMKDNK